MLVFVDVLLSWDGRISRLLILFWPEKNLIWLILTYENQNIALKTKILTFFYPIKTEKLWPGNQKNQNLDNFLT